MNPLTSFQINNDSALNFYRRHGFEVVETKEQYYKRIEPADAHVLEKKVERRKNNNKANVNGDSKRED